MKIFNTCYMINPLWVLAIFLALCEVASPHKGSVMRSVILVAWLCYHLNLEWLDMFLQKMILIQNVFIVEVNIFIKIVLEQEISNQYYGCGISTRASATTILTQYLIMTPGACTCLKVNPITGQWNYIHYNPYTIDVMGCLKHIYSYQIICWCKTIDSKIAFYWWNMY